MSSVPHLPPRPRWPTRRLLASASVTKMDPYAAGVLHIFFHPVITRLDVLAFEETQDPLLELPRPLARDDLDGLGLLAFRVVDGVIQGLVDAPALVEDGVQVELEPHSAPFTRFWQDDTCGVEQKGQPVLIALKIAVPGIIRPRTGPQPPHTWLLPSSHSGSTRSTKDRPAPLMSRTQSPIVRWCST